MMEDKPILVTKPFLPPQSEYMTYLKGVWERCWLTNDGPLVRELERRLEDYFEVDNLIFLTNGTIAIQLAIKALNLSGEIITTPFSYVATTSSIVWENCEPIFVDIFPERFTINTDLIEEKITERTSAILSTHVFGNPCNMDAIARLADKFDLKVIYDAAHCFGTLYHDKSVMQYGDVSCISFHATKLFHTIEGGAVTTSDDGLAYRLRKMRNFGHNGPLKFEGVGINGKNSEVHAAMGLVNLNHMDNIMSRRREQVELYKSLLSNTELRFQQIEKLAVDNSAYCAILTRNESTTIRVQEKLRENRIGSRRYFNPSLNKLDYTRGAAQSCPISEDVADRVLCLPVYHDLSDDDIKRVSEIIKSTI